MVNEVLNGVSNQLFTKFGVDYRYYVEDVEQNLNKPCFTMNCIVPLQRSRSNVLYNRTFPIVVHYFGLDRADTKKDCYEKAELMVEALEYIPVKGSLIRGENISWQIVDGVLQVFVTYTFITAKDSLQEQNMEVVENDISNNN